MGHLLKLVRAFCVTGLMFAAAGTACGIPGVPSLPAAGAPPLPVAWPDADRAARLAAAAPLVVEAGAPASPCFREHLEEAIELNEARMPKYSAWTGGASEPVSTRLIAGERRGILVARYVDRQARRYHAAGVLIVCAEFIPMWRTPLLGDAPDPPPGVPVPPAPDGDELQRALVAAYGAGGFAGVVHGAVAELERLKAAPMYHCMVRHMLESVARVAALAPLHHAAATRAGLPSTIPLSELMFRLHLAVLRDASALDAMAAPFQAMGVPIVCRDVPAIPYPKP